MSCCPDGNAAAPAFRVGHRRSHGELQYFSFLILYVSILAHYMMYSKYTPPSLSGLLCTVLCIAPQVVCGQEPPNLYLAPTHDALAWDALAPAASNLSVREGLVLALPAPLQQLPLSVERGLESHVVTLPGGLTRRQSVQRLVPPGAVLLVFEAGIVLTKGRLLTTAAPASSAPADMPSPPIASGTTGFQVLVADHTLRGTLERWSRQAGWTFNNDFWSLPRDLPIRAASHFGGNFKAAVVDLLKSSEATDMPAKPCFYSNRVLRVVVYADACNRSSGTP